MRIRGWRDRRVVVAASAATSVILAALALLGRSRSDADGSIAPRSASTTSAPAHETSVPATETYAIPPEVSRISAAVERTDDGETIAAPTRSVARKVTMAAREPRVIHDRKQAASRSSASEAAPTNPRPLPGATTRTRVRLVDDEARVRIIE